MIIKMQIINAKVNIKFPFKNALLQKHFYLHFGWPWCNSILIINVIIKTLKEKKSKTVFFNCFELLCFLSLQDNLIIILFTILVTLTVANGNCLNKSVTGGTLPRSGANTSGWSYAVYCWAIHSWYRISLLQVNKVLVAYHMMKEQVTEHSTS